MDTSAPRRLARAVTHPRVVRWLAGIPLLLAVALIALVPAAEHAQSPVDSLPDGYDSTLAAQLQAELPDDAAEVALVLWTSREGALDQPTLSELEAQTGSPVTVSENGEAALGVVPVTVSSSTQRLEVIEDLRATVSAEAPDGVDVVVTGPSALQADFAQVFDGADFRLLGATAVVVAILLILTYRSPVLWIVPLLVVGIADRTASIAATHVLGAFDMAWNESTVGILSVLVFGAGTNYALLLISRYRDELKRTEDRHEAMARAWLPTVEAVAASASTVVLGLLTLLGSLVPNTRGLGLACAVGVVIAAAFVLLVLPATMLLFGRGLFWPLVPRVGQALLVDSERSVWSRIGRAVDARPKTFVAGSLVVVALLAVGATQIRTGLPTDEQFLDTPESISGAATLAENFPAGSAEPVTVLTRQSPEEVEAALGEVTDVAAVRVTARTDDVARLDVTTTTSPGTAEGEETVRAIRSALEGIPDTHVGGGTAEALDEADGADEDWRTLVPLILVLVVAALILLLRSLVAPLFLVATVLGTYAAAMGASWWVFTGVLGFSALDTSVPLLAFLFLVALGVDYNIFLVTRALEERAQVGTRTGILRALTATGGVITSAGILLASVFAVLGVLPLVLLAQFGVVVFIGVLLDTLLVRTVLVPALVLSVGERFWWPRKA